MNPKIAIALIVLVHCTTAHAVVTFDWAVVGNPGNGPDDTGFGAVDYVYRISKHEVTNAQYAEFLNAVGIAVSNLRGLYSPRMASDVTGGIDLPRGSGEYQLKPGRGDNPVNYVSAFDAMRFVNWLHNGQPTDGSGTESGVYDFGVSLNRNPSAKYFIPSENEWYKAAYHKNNGVTGGAENYWEYPTSTDAEPYSDEPPGSDAPDQTNTANFGKSDGIDNGYDDGTALAGPNFLTDVGAYAMSVSPYGTFDQGGNVGEWNEAAISSSTGVWRGGSWYPTSSEPLAASRSLRSGLQAQEAFIGFRVASIIPEPGTGLLAVFGLLALRQRRRTRS